MKTKIYTWLIAVTLTLAALLSCTEEYSKDARSPRFEALTLTPSTASPGDSIHAIVSYADKGKSIYKSEYTYTVSGRNIETGQDTTFSHSWRVIDPTRYQPTFSFAAPRFAGTFTVRFEATQINYATSGPNGELYGSANSVSTTLTVQ